MKIILIFLSAIFLNNSLCAGNDIPVYKCAGSVTDCSFRNVKLTLDDYQWQPTSNNPDSVEIVKFYSSVIPVVTDNICTTFESLETLVITYSGVQEIEENAFHNCTNLKTLYLSYNPITKLLPDTFKGLDNLIYLDLGNTQMVELTDVNLFAELTNLTTLDLERNKLTEFPAELLKNNQNLNVLHLYSNDLSDLDVEQLVEFLPELSTLAWNDNLISCSRAKEAIELLISQNISYSDGYNFKVRSFEKQKVNGGFTCQSDISWIRAHCPQLNCNFTKQTEVNLQLQMLAEIIRQNDTANQEVDEPEISLSAFVDQKITEMAQQIMEKVEESHTSLMNKMIALMEGLKVSHDACNETSA